MADGLLLSDELVEEAYLALQPAIRKPGEQANRWGCVERSVGCAAAKALNLVVESILGVCCSENNYVKLSKTQELGSRNTVVLELANFVLAFCRMRRSETNASRGKPHLLTFVG